MDKLTFQNRLNEAPISARDFTRGIVFENLPDAIRFNLKLNALYDKNLEENEVVFPNDSINFTQEELMNLSGIEVVKIL